MKNTNIHKNVTKMATFAILAILLFCYKTETKYEWLALALIALLTLVTQVAAYKYGESKTKGKILWIHNLPLRTIFKVKDIPYDGMIRIVDTRKAPHSDSLIEREDFRYVSVINANSNFKIGQLFMLDERPVKVDQSIGVERSNRTICTYGDCEILVIHV